MIGPEGIVFGAGHHLPDARALTDFDFRANSLALTDEGGSFAIANVPGRDDCVVRVQPLLPNDEEGYYTIAREGIAHFNQMVDGGLVLPAQRHVVSNDTLYTFTERINGRALTSDPKDGALSEPVIDGLSQYYLWVHGHPQEARRFLWDKAFSWQHTVTDDPQRVLLHDIGLDFEATRNRIRRPDGLLYSCGLWLGEWATSAEIKYPTSLKRLLAKEPLPNRLLRRLVTKMLSPGTKEE